MLNKLLIKLSIINLKYLEINRDLNLNLHQDKDKEVDRKNKVEGIEYLFFCFNL
jgi:hypothetical protein